MSTVFPMILLCAHKDTVIPNPPVTLQYGRYVGLLDNFLGVMAVHSVLYRNHSLLKMVERGKLGIYHSQDEEFLLNLPEQAVVPDLAIAVDVVSGKKYEGLDAAIENLTIDDQGFGSDLSRFVNGEGYRVSVKRFTGEEMDADESWMWHSLTVPTFSLLLPIDVADQKTQDSGASWHRTDCSCPVRRVEKFLDILTRVICYCEEDYGTTPCTDC